MNRQDYYILQEYMKSLLSIIKDKISAADATAKEAEEKRNEYDKIMKEEYSRGRHYREVLNMLDEMNQNYYNDMKKLEKQQYNTTAQTTTDPNSIITAYNTTRANEEVRVDGNQT